MKHITLKCNRCSSTLSVDVNHLFAGETVAILRQEQHITCSKCGKEHVGGEVIKISPRVTKHFHLTPFAPYAPLSPA